MPDLRRWTNRNSVCWAGDERQAIASIGFSSDLTSRLALFQDDEKTHVYEKSGGSITKLIWDDAAHQLKHEGPAAWTGPDDLIVTVVGK